MIATSIPTKIATQSLLITFKFKLLSFCVYSVMLAMALVLRFIVRRMHQNGETGIIIKRVRKAFYLRHAFPLCIDGNK